MTRLDAAMLFVSVAAPLAVCASRVQPYTDAAHDEAVVRALGLGWTGAFRALDVVVAHLFLALPIGTRALRAGLAGAAMCGVAGGLLFAVARRVLAACKTAPVVTPIVAALVSLCASLSGAWIVESSTAGSSILGVVLGLLPLVVVAGPASASSWPLLAGSLGLAVSYEPLVGLISGIGALGHLSLTPALSRMERVPSPERAVPASPSGIGAGGEGTCPARRLSLACALAFAAGCLPFGVAWVCGRFADHRLAASVWASPMGEGAHLEPRTVVELVGAEMGWTLLGLSVAGAALVLVGRRSRAPGAAVLGVVLASALAVTLGAPAGPWRFGAPALLLVGAGAVLAGVALEWAVVAVAEARVPLAAASAAMVVVLALTFPVLTLDDAIARSEARATGGTRIWDDAAFEVLPAGTLLLVPDAGLYARALASKAAGELRGDLSLVPLFAAADAGLEAELAARPDLKPLLRDYLLYGEARERTLSSVSASRPLALGIVPSWEHALSRHLVPCGLFAMFHPEPRGTSERLLAIDDASIAAGPLHDAIVLPRDAGLATLTTRLLDARARSLASLGEKDAAARVADEALTLALPGTRGARHARRLVTSRFARVTPSR